MGHVDDAHRAIGDGQTERYQQRIEPRLRPINKTSSIQSNPITFRLPAADAR